MQRSRGPLQADHQEVSLEQERSRVARWRTQYPQLFDRFRDADGPAASTPRSSRSRPRYTGLNISTHWLNSVEGWEVKVHFTPPQRHVGGCSRTARRSFYGTRRAATDCSHTVSGRTTRLCIHPRQLGGARQQRPRRLGVRGERQDHHPPRNRLHADPDVPAVPIGAESYRSIRSTITGRPQPSTVVRHRGPGAGWQPPCDALLLIEGPLCVWWPNFVRESRAAHRVAARSTTHRATVHGSAFQALGGCRLSRQRTARLDLRESPRTALTRFNADVHQQTLIRRSSIARSPRRSATVRRTNCTT